MLGGVNATLRIGAVSRLTGLSVSAIRYYEDEGLIQPVTRTDAGYRLYEADTVARLNFIRRAKALGLRLADIADVLHSPDAGAEREALRHRIAHRLADVSEQVDELRALEGSLQRLYVQVARQACGCRHFGDCDCPAVSPTTQERSLLAAETAAAHTGACSCGCGPVNEGMLGVAG